MGNAYYDQLHQIADEVAALEAQGGQFLPANSDLSSIATTNPTAANIPLNNKRLTGAASGIAGTDVATVGQTLPSTSDLRSIAVANATTGDVPMNAHKLTGLASGVAGTDAATVGQTLPSTSDLSSIANANATAADVSLAHHKLTNLLDGVLTTDAATVGELPIAAGPAIGFGRVKYDFASTTVAAGSNGVDVSTFTGSGTLNAASISGGAWNAPSTAVVDTNSALGWAVLSYTGTTGTTLTGVQLVYGSGQLATGGIVSSGPSITDVIQRGYSVMVLQTAIADGTGDTHNTNAPDKRFITAVRAMMPNPPKFLMYRVAIERASDTSGDTTFTRPSQNSGNTAWYLYDYQGSTYGNVGSTDGSFAGTNPQMDIGNPGYQAAAVSRAIAMCQAAGYDGDFTDNTLLYGVGDANIYLTNTGVYGTLGTALTTGSPITSVSITSASSTVAAGSNGVNVNTFTGAGTLNVASNSGFPPTGAISVPTSGGTAIITYTGLGSNTLTGCNFVSGNAGTLSTGGTVTQGIPSALTAGQTIQLDDGLGHKQNMVVGVGGAAQAATTIPVNSITPSFAFPQTTTQVTVPYGSLSSGLSTGGNITSIPTTALTGKLIAGQTFQLDDNAGHTQLWTVGVGGANINATSIPVVAQTPNFNYPANSTNVVTTMTSASYYHAAWQSFSTYRHQQYQAAGLISIGNCGGTVYKQNAVPVMKAFLDSGMDGLMDEGFMSTFSTTATVFFPPSMGGAVNADNTPVATNAFQIIQYAELKQKTMLLHSYVQGGPYGNTGNNTSVFWLGLAGALLAGNGRTCYIVDNDSDGVTNGYNDNWITGRGVGPWLQPYDKARELGRPIGPASLDSNNVYSRFFEKGFVIVSNNNSGVASTTPPEIAGINMGAHGADILLYRHTKTPLAYGTTVTPLDPTISRYQRAVANNTTAFTVANPPNTPTTTEFQEFTLEIHNVSGGVLGAITWGSLYVFPTAWTSPATTKSRKVRFEWNGSNWIADPPTAADF